MSLILEALKKSERQRRLGESPSLGSPVMAVHRRRSLLPALIVLIVLGLLALWWFRRESSAPEAQPQVTATATTTPAPAVLDSTTFNDNPPPPPVPVNVPRQMAQSTAASRQPRSKVPAEAGGELALDPGKKTSSGDEAEAKSQPGKPDQALAIDESKEAAAAAGVNDSIKEQKAAAAAMGRAAADAKARSDNTVVQADNAPAAAAVPAAAAAVADPGSGIKLMWELPYATRRDLPEIKLSMHVYAEQPAQRFVIINGDRQVEGDEVGNLHLVEIRRDGVVFDFEGVRFLYPRGGR